MFRASQAALVSAGPGDIVHGPAGHARRRRPSATGGEPIRHFITVFS